MQRSLKNRLSLINEIITLYELNGKISEITGNDPSKLELLDKTGFIETRRNILDLLIDLQKKVLKPCVSTHRPSTPRSSIAIF